jgi:hypothetical protein
MRPRTIVAFEKLWIVFVLLSLLHFVHDVPAHSGPSIMEPTILRLGSDAGFLILVLFVSRMRSRLAKWLFVVYVAIYLPDNWWRFISRAGWSMLGSIVSLFDSGLTLIQLILMTITPVMLFTPASRSWLKAKATAAQANTARR